MAMRSLSPMRIAVAIKSNSAQRPTTSRRYLTNLSCLRRIPRSALHLTEPNPGSVGNSPNAVGNPNWTERNWLRSFYHFAFYAWKSPITNFGVLEVLNDDLVQPNRGFHTHGHKDAEIATIVLQGELTHKDSMGSQGTITRGSVQHMSAGSGVKHSEMNLSKDKVLRVLQIWFKAPAKNLTPTYGGYDGSTEEAKRLRSNQWAHLVALSSGKDAAKVPIQFRQDVNIYVAETDANTELDFEVENGRQAYIVNAEGTTIISNSQTRRPLGEFLEGDAAECFGPLEFSFKSVTPGFHVIIEMAYEGKSRFDEASGTAGST